jgi:predicted metal-dependent phosphoesterase TrpH
MSGPTFDLQSHSLHSDGALAPAEVVANAAAAGVELLALSDHDTVDGVDEALAAAAEHDTIAIVPATEISAVHGRYEDLHVLGYGIDHHDPVLAERLLGARADRERRAERMAAKLVELGWQVDDALLAERRAAGKPIGRPHLTQAVLSHPANAERLAAEGYDDVSAFLPDFLIPGKPAYLARTRPTVGEAIGWIHDAGGVAIWAHPFWDLDGDAETIEAIDLFRAEGLDGVECFYPTHNAEQTDLLAGRCAELGLIATGSSDYHGPEHRLFSKFLVHDLHGHVPDLSALRGSAARGAA